ncbi:MAG: hypothetical protein Q8Q18_03760 [bacterium]|nr:hypothetical protein [bacterium]
MTDLQMENFQYYLEIATKLVSIIAASSLVVAIEEYRNDKRHKKLLAVVDQVSFFREKILGGNAAFISRIRAVDPRYEFARVPMDEPSGKVVKTKFKKLCDAQVATIKDFGTPEEEVVILNMLEELSLQIKYAGTRDHKALVSIKPGFVKTVEMHAVALLAHREAISGNALFSNVLELYACWKDSVDRKNSTDRAPRFFDL